MRLTQTLLAFRRGFWFKNIWKNKRKTTVKEMDYRPAMKFLGVEPIDPLENENFFGVKKTKVWIPPDDPRFMFPSRSEDHVDWHQTSAYTCNDQVKLWEGLPQVQILTNCLIERGLPPDVLTNLDQFSLPGQDHLIQRTILQAHLWDTTREKLPKRKKPDDISIWNYKTELGIPESRAAELLYQGITQRCFQALSITDPYIVNHLRLIREHQMNTNFVLEKNPIYLACKSLYLLTSDKPLSRFASKEQVLATRDRTIDNIWPMTAFVDLEKSHIYKTDGCLGYTSDYSCPHSHTLLLVHSKDWTMDQRHANALVMSYAHCLESAKYHNATESLMNEPVCVQTIHTDGESFGYTCFQLNAMANSVTEGASKRYNLAWIDDDLLFNKVLPRRSMLRDTKYRQYNPNVFRKILGLFSRS
ncbi:large ribosomal subunit protein mL37-like [Watersipora subatra]|uniref:large ribosomal subunit protein mL37-like n=1 Tax=Watersipora subatra TaxID=2589382 RepID=UPI00355BD13C